MYCKEILTFCLLAVTLQNAYTLPIGCPGSVNSLPNGFNPQPPLPETMPGGPVITEIVPSLQFGDISVTGDLPVGGNIRVKGVFPVYGTVALDGGIPSTGVAVVNTAAGAGVCAQIV